jgi:peptidylprolyl isomerase
MRFESKLIRTLATTSAVAALVLTIGCGGGNGGVGDRVIAQGDSVSLIYEGTLDDGSVFSATDSTQPFNFVAGQGQVIPGFDEAVIGMKLHEKKTFTIPDTMAYGPRREEAIQKVDHSFFPEDMKPEVGNKIFVGGAQGQRIPATIVAVDGDSVTLDMNHELAGEDLTFKIEVIEIK